MDLKGSPFCLFLALSTTPRGPGQVRPVLRRIEWILETSPPLPLPPSRKGWTPVEAVEGWWDLGGHIEEIMGRCPQGFGKELEVK